MLVVMYVDALGPKDNGATNSGPMLSDWTGAPSAPTNCAPLFPYHILDVVRRLTNNILCVLVLVQVCTR